VIERTEVTPPLYQKWIGKKSTEGFGFGVGCNKRGSVEGSSLVGE
jgi:hypothetical protein